MIDRNSNPVGWSFLLDDLEDAYEHLGNLIKEQFLESRDWPFGAALSLVLTLLVLGVAALSARMAGRRARQ